MVVVAKIKVFYFHYPYCSNGLLICQTHMSHVRLKRTSDALDEASSVYGVLNVLTWVMPWKSQEVNGEDKKFLAAVWFLVALDLLETTFDISDQK